MPFIREDLRDQPDVNGLDELCEYVAEECDAGEMAYIVYRLLKAAAPSCENFEQRNAMMGAVDEARLTYRRLVHDPAEDAARERNGDVL